MHNLTALNWLDIVFGLIVLSSAVAGLRAGFTRVVIGLGATILGFVLGFWFYRLLGERLHPLIANVTAANATAFFLIFFVILLAGSIAAAILSRMLRWVGLSWFNYLLGGAAGAVRGAVVIAVLANVLVAFAPSPIPDYLKNSRILPYADRVASGLALLAPQELKDSFFHQMDNLKQIWAAHDRHAG